MHKLTFLPFWTTRLAHSLSHLHLLLHSYIGVPSSTRNFPAKLYAILWALNDGQHVFSVFMPHLPSGHSHPIGGSSGMIIPSQGCKKLSRSSKYNFNNIWMKFNHFNSFCKNIRITLRTPGPPATPDCWKSPQN